MQFSLNGAPVSVEGVSPNTTLLQFLRDRGLTGAKEGCAEGECGACAVAVVQACGDGGTSAYRAVNSCLLFLPMLAGQEVYTVEAFAADGRLLDAQQAMVEQGGSQCGYCTPGFVVSLFAEQYRPDRNGPCDPEALAGNLCRCTGYRPIRDAARSLGPAPHDRFRERLTHAAPAMKGSAYTARGEWFRRPDSLEECTALLAAHPEARLIAGGTDLGVDANLRHVRFPELISVEAVPELRVFADAEDRVVLGAGLPLNELGRRWTHAPAMVREWLHLFASPLLRNRATLGGSLATASPIGDAAPVLLALDAQVRLASAQGERTVPLESFFTGYRKTTMRPGELIVAVDVPKPLPALSQFYKVAKRRLDDISTIAAGFAIQLDDQGRVRTARLSYGGVAATPVRATEAEEALLGHAWDHEAVQRACAVLAKTLHPLTDHRGSAAYRLAIAQSVLTKFWWSQQQQQEVPA